MKYPLEPTSKEVRQMLAITTDRLIEFLDNIGTSANFNSAQATVQAQQQKGDFSETPQSLEEILDDLFKNRIPNALPTTHPGFMAYVPGGGIFHAGLADLIAKVSNRYVGIDAVAPLMNQIEVDVVKWLCEMIGYPTTSGGTLTSGGSLANLTAVICARTLVMGDEFAKGCVYASEFVHHSQWKAFHAAGITSSRIRTIPVDYDFKLDNEALQRSIEEDIKNDLTPMMIVATAGSTNTGSIDSLKILSGSAKQHKTWIHGDAAYGGLFSMIKEGKERLCGIELADSITLDPHKGMFLPYGTGAFIVRDRELLKSVFTHEADYMPTSSIQQDIWNFSEMSLELTRPFRGLAIWLPLKMLGANAFREALTEKLELADYFYQKVASNPQWQIVAKPQLSITVFKYSNNSMSIEQQNYINHEIIEYVNTKGRANISGTIIDDYTVIRCCVLSFRTHKIHLDHLLEDLNEALSSCTTTK
ncbi:MAG: aminotransferase class V-fold PLP-dependent enzyme [Kangiellaceae bacterium]|nr:aminotransferase class V-fold PLP-dependent enzyme [Kangiellaceae bacterium]